MPKGIKIFKLKEDVKNKQPSRSSRRQSDFKRN